MGLFSSNTAQLPRSKTEEERQANIRRGSDYTSEYNNPCLKEEKLLYKCLTEVKDKVECAAFMENCKACKRFWHRVKQERRTQGIIPNLPWPEEREGVRNEYLKKWNIHHKSASADDKPPT